MYGSLQRSFGGMHVILCITESTSAWYDFKIRYFPRIYSKHMSLCSLETKKSSSPFPLVLKKNLIIISILPSLSTQLFKFLIIHIKSSNIFITNFYSFQSLFKQNSYATVVSYCSFW